ncbi:MAG: hypothetical protein WBA10_06790 [Elainellaceae cyanobacterium]
MTFLIALRLFEKDDTTPRSDAYSWVVLLLASAFWPVTAVSMLRKAVLGSGDHKTTSCPPVEICEV